MVIENKRFAYSTFEFMHEIGDINSLWTIEEFQDQMINIIEETGPDAGGLYLERPEDAPVWIYQAYDRLTEGEKEVISYTVYCSAIRYGLVDREIKQTLENPNIRFDIEKPEPYYIPSDIEREGEGESQEAEYGGIPDESPRLGSPYEKVEKWLLVNQDQRPYALSLLAGIANGHFDSVEDVQDEMIKGAYLTRSMAPKPARMNFPEHIQIAYDSLDSEDQRRLAYCVPSLAIRYGIVDGEIEKILYRHREDATVAPEATVA